MNMICKMIISYEKFYIRPDFIVVLSSNQQLTALKRFCTRHLCSILGIDPTFHFGDFDVTVTTYRHKILEDTTPGKDMIDKTPVFVRPGCVHKYWLYAVKNTVLQILYRMRAGGPNSIQYL